jgi:uncharacterized protein involved in exopolysaccharide biosynthesis
MLVAFVAALAGGWLVVGKRPVRYRADAYLVVAQALPPELSSREVPLVRDVIRATAARSLATQVAIMKTPAVMGRAYEDLPRRYHSLLQSGTAGSGPSISATALSEEAVRSDMIRVSVTWCDPEAAAALANAIARRHIRFTREFNRDWTRRVGRWRMRS